MTRQRAVRRPLDHSDVRDDPVELVVAIGAEHQPNRLRRHGARRGWSTPGVSSRTRAARRGPRSPGGPRGPGPSRPAPRPRSRRPRAPPRRAGPRRPSRACGRRRRPPCRLVLGAPASRSTSATSSSSMTRSASVTLTSSSAAAKRCRSRAGSPLLSRTSRSRRAACSSTSPAPPPAGPGSRWGTRPAPRSRGPVAQCLAELDQPVEPVTIVPAARDAGGRTCSPACRKRSPSRLHTRSGSAPPRARLIHTSSGGEVGPAAQEATPCVFP